jgi:outer membrane protein OmpA-like peptidoglycan-associated protein
MGEPLTTDQAQRLVKGIWWKNTQENFEHFGLRAGGNARTDELHHLDEMIRKITRVLVGTQAIKEDPTGGNPQRLYHDRLLAGLLSSQWHPSAIAGVGDESIRSQTAARPLDEAEWSRLTPVGHLQVDRIVFRPQSAVLLASSEGTLEKLVDTLRSWPHYYLIVRGHARMEGDAELNKQLAEDRAKAVAVYLAQHGIAEHRVRALGAQTAATGGEAQTVTFALGQLPY